MKNQEEIIDSFLDTIEKRQKKCCISYSYHHCNNKEKYTDNISLLKLDNLTIKKNNNSIIFDIHVINCRFLQLARIGSVNIAFDRNKINEAGEWDIINLDSSFVITKTLSSFLNNKIWAWLERSREIWKDEFPSITGTVIPRTKNI